MPMTDASGTEIMQAVCPANAPALYLDAGQQAYGLGIDWFGISLLALLASVLIMVVFYLLSMLMNDRRALPTLKLELSELFVTLLILVFVGVAMRGMCSADTDILGPNIWPFKDADDMPMVVPLVQVPFVYFQEVSDGLYQALYVTHGASMFTDELANTTVYGKPLGVGVVSNPVAGLIMPLNKLLYNSITAIAIAFILNEAQIYVFRYAYIGFMFYFLPIGLFLRCFTVTRKIGGALIAIALGFMVVYPLLLLVSAGIINDFGSWTIYSDAEAVNDAGSQFSNVFSKPSGFLQAFSTAVGGFTSAVSYLFSSVSAVLDSGASMFLGTTASPLLFRLIWVSMGNIAYTFMAGYLLPVINFLILVQAVKGMSRMIGEEVDVSSLTRLI
ncbi:MAG: hypothetical protein ACP5NX_03455 [Candidatus Bilamarchaeaceae archaeon]